MTACIRRPAAWAACWPAPSRSLRTEAPGAMLVVPVPLHRAKLAQRGFNQARMLAGEALKLLQQEPSCMAAHIGSGHSGAPARHGKPGRAHSAGAAHESCAARFKVADPAAVKDRRTFSSSTTF